MAVSHKRREMDGIQSDYERDHGLALLRKGAIQYVAGEGSLKPVAVILGEAPGQHEDEEGKPFCGTAGELLDSLIELVGLTRGDFYITNVVKYRPSRNRTPTDLEVKYSYPYLARELDVVNTKHVIAMGRVALDALFRGRGLTPQPLGQTHGYRHEGLVEGKFVWSTYHPAATFYRRDLYDVLVDDFSHIIREILGMEAENGAETT